MNIDCFFVFFQYVMLYLICWYAYIFYNILFYILLIYIKKKDSSSWFFCLLAIVVRCLVVVSGSPVVASWPAWEGAAENEKSLDIGLAAAEQREREA